MIRINLLPDAQRKGRPSKAGAAPKVSAGDGSGGPMLALALIAIVVVVGGLGFRAYQKVQTVQSEYDKLNAKKNDLAKKIADEGQQANEIYDLRNILDSQWTILQSLDNRILWSEKLNLLAKLIPANVFLTEISVTEDYKEVETQASIEARRKYEEEGKKGERPEVQKKPVVSYNVKLSGIATGESPVTQLDNVQKFHTSLVSFKTTDNKGVEHRFMDGFSPVINFEYVQATLYDKQYPVQQFLFTLTTLPQGAEEKPAGGEGTKDAAAPAPAAKAGAKK